MCGLSAIIGNTAPLEQRLTNIAAMTAAIPHRGPNGEGFKSECDDCVLLAHRRLSIIDLDSRSDQPMSFERLTIIFNGEIYNYIELRKELELAGYTFDTEGDTEVALKAYHHWGVDAFSKFNGMWSILIVDKESENTIVSRDRWGIKPLYYTEHSGDLYIFSEIKQVCSFAKKKVNYDVLSEYLFSGYVEYSEETFFNKIYKFPQACYAIINSAGKIINKAKYYDLAQAVKNTKDAKLFDRIKEAVDLRLRCDVKSGTCLSGGLDSGIVSTLASKTYGEGFMAITAATKDPKLDETPYAAAIASANSLDWVVTRPSIRELHERLSDLVWTQEEPFNGLSLFMQYCVQKDASEHDVKVLLDGQGGDEILLGYQKYVVPILIERFKTSGFLSALKHFFDIKKNNSSVNFTMVLKYYIAIRFPRLRRLVELRTLPIASTFIKRQYRAIVSTSFSRASFKSVQDLQITEIEQTNLPALLRYEDKNSMRFSVEARLPLLDYRVVECALHLSTDQKTWAGKLKSPFKTSDLLPPEITARKDKIGFAPGADLEVSQLNSLLDQHKNSSRILRKILTRKGTNEITLLSSTVKWRLLNIALWEEIYDVKA